jgi:hypothetical protein
VTSSDVPTLEQAKELRFVRHVQRIRTELLRAGISPGCGPTSVVGLLAAVVARRFADLEEVALSPLKWEASKEADSRILDDLALGKRDR